MSRRSAYLVLAAAILAGSVAVSSAKVFRRLMGMDMPKNPIA
jgi:hypothetical protein